MKRLAPLWAFALLLCAGCANDLATATNGTGSSGQAAISHGTTTYVDTTTHEPSGVIDDDLYETFAADGTVYVTFSGTSVSAYIGDGNAEPAVTATTTEQSLGTISDKKVSIQLSENTLEDADNDIDEASNGVIIQYKGSGRVKYVLSGDYTGTVFIKNKNADAAVVLNGVRIASDGGAGPVMRFSSEQRTFVVVPAGTENTLTDTRVLGQSGTMYDDKKGSVYAKGALIVTGTDSTAAGGTLSVVNSGYKHAIYAKDYVRVADVTLNVTVANPGRDCIRAVNAVIVDGGTITLNGNGTQRDDESVGIKVEGEDADDDDLTVAYTCGAGFVIINGGTLNITTVAKGITAHWKSASSAIGKSGYTEVKNESLLYGALLSGTACTTPNPYVEVNGGTITVTTTGTPYESTTASCSPEGIEAKADLTINAGTLTLTCTDDAINAGGSVRINGGAVYAYSSQNDAIDANGSGGITIAGGTVVAVGVTTPECAFDCDDNPLTITGGLLVGIGTSNYSKPQNCTQSTVVISAANATASKTFAICDGSGSAVFAYDIPASYEVMVLSAPALETGTTYTIHNGVTASGTQFHGLYTGGITLSSAGTSGTSFSTSSTVTTVGTISGGGPQEGNRPTTPGGRR